MPEPPEFIAGTLAYMAPEQTGRMNRSIDARSDLYALVDQFRRDVDTTNKQGMTQRDEIGGLLCGLNARDPGDRQRIPLRHSAVSKRCNTVSAEQHPSCSRCRTSSHSLAGNVNHPGVTCGAEMRKTTLAHSSP